ncbi:hypothetical protein Patl1_34797 [Pistacia atlantica]|uniref:Uncharacterized protein n=1 Tax=Pistacia atlantica TaxID=434234 RepID=A0ACC0ZND1_9ROSI|nr:hypothetical protein Patl1_34797 [Pistacia atlantica]
MGEPLHNVGNVIKASDIMVHEQGLHFSLNSTTDEVINWIMPSNRNQVRPVLRGRGTSQSSNNPTGPSQWRYPALVSLVFCPSFTANPYLVTHPVQHTTKPQTDSSISESIQAAPSPAPPVQTAPFPPKTQIFCPVSQTAAALFILFHVWPMNLYLVMWCKDDMNDRHYNSNAAITLLYADFDKPLQPSGRECLFSKRDLSFTLEANGPISQPSIPPSVAVLPCGHYFHTRCLEKSTDPP